MLQRPTPEPSRNGKWSAGSTHQRAILASIRAEQIWLLAMSRAQGGRKNRVEEKNEEREMGTREMTTSQPPPSSLLDGLPAGSFDGGGGRERRQDGVGQRDGGATRSA